MLAATARRVRGARALLDGNGLALPLVGLNGALGRHPDGTSFHAVPFTPAAATAALGAFVAAGLHPCVYVSEPDIDVVLPPDPSSHPGHLASLDGVTRTADLPRTVATEPVYAFSVLGRPEGDLMPVAVALDAAGFGFDCAPEPIWPGWGITAMAPGVSKWAGVEAFCVAVGRSPDDVVAVGDNTNDVPMLEAAAWPLTVAGSTAARLLPDADTIDPPARDGWSEIPALLRRRAAS